MKFSARTVEASGDVRVRRAMQSVPEGLQPKLGRSVGQSLQREVVEFF